MKAVLKRIFGLRGEVDGRWNEPRLHWFLKEGGLDRYSLKKNEVYIFLNRRSTIMKVMARDHGVLTERLPSNQNWRNWFATPEGREMILEYLGSCFGFKIQESSYAVRYITKDLRGYVQVGVPLKIPIPPKLVKPRSVGNVPKRLRAVA